MSKKTSNQSTHSNVEVSDRNITTHNSQSSLSPENFQKWLETTERLVKLVAESWRTGGNVRRILIVGAIAFFTLNPGVAGKVASSFFAMASLPSGYTTVFWMGMLAIALISVVVAITNIPRRRAVSLDDSIDRPAIKGLRSFKKEDADIFSRLKRKTDIQDCLTAITSSEFRFGQLLGESGCGKSSLLQAGILPRLSGTKATHIGIYVKLRARNPIEEIQRTLFELELITDANFQTSFNGKLVSLMTEAVQMSEKPLVLILDQFEQFYVQYKQFEERQSFIYELKGWYNSNLPVSVLISVREDYAGRLIDIHKVLGYQLGPNQIFRLEKFRPDQAAAILKVMAKAENMDVNDSFVESLAQTELASPEDGKISPVDLQILVWMLDRYAIGTTRALNQKSFQQLGGVDGLLTCFLQRTLAVLPTQTPLKILVALTNLERRVRAGTLSLEELKTKLPILSLESIAEAAEWLARGDVRLVTRINRDGRSAYELAHERLIPAILSLADQELTEGDRAKQLLNRRVNEWQGNNRSSRYLLTWRELRLLQQQRAYVVFGKNRIAKEQLLKHSYRRMRRKIFLVGIPSALVFGCILWSFTLPGKMQLVRWRAVNITNYGIYPGSSFITAANMDMVIGMKKNPFPRLWLRWFAHESYEYDDLSKIIQIAEITTDNQLTLQLLGQVSSVVKGQLDLSERDSRRKYINPSSITLLSEVAHVYYTNLNDETTARDILSEALKSSETLDENNRKFEAMSSIAATYSNLQDFDTARDILSEALKSSETLDEDDQKVKAMSSIATAYSKLQDFDAASDILSEALEISSAITNESDRDDAVQAISSAAGEIQDVEVAKRILLEAIQISRTINNDSWKAGSLSAISGAAGKLPSDVGLNLLLDMLKSSETLDEDDQKVKAMSSIATAYSRLQDFDAASDILSEALEISSAITNESDRDDAVQAISSAAGEIQDVEVAKRILLEAIQISRTINNDSWKAGSLSAISGAAGKLENFKMTEQLLFEVLYVSESLESGYSKADTLIDIIQTVNSLDNIPATNRILARTMEIASSMDDQDDYYRDRVMARVAQVHIRLGERERAEDILDNLANEKIDNNFFHSEEVGVAYVDLGHINRALRYSHGLDSRAKLTVYARILRNNAEQQLPALKKLSEIEVSD